MFCKCPECRTTFKVSRNQLTARNGLVRCGKCSAVFNGNQSLFQQLPKSRKKPAVPATTGSATQRAGSGASGASTENSAASARETTRSPGRDEKKGGDAAIPTVTERLPWTQPTHRTRPIFWLLGIMLLLVILTGQILHYYRSELAQFREIEPLVQQYCRLTDCDTEQPRKVGLIDLTKTAISPHPTYQNILRVRATMVNRAAFNQPYPLMEVTLTDSGGKIIARRAFEPRQYLGGKTEMNESLRPHVAVDALLDITNPDLSAVGYEIQLVAP